MPFSASIRLLACGLPAVSLMSPAVAELKLPAEAPGLPSAIALQPAAGLEIRWRRLQPSDPTGGAARLEGIASGPRWALRSSMLVAGGEQRLARLDSGVQLDGAGPLQTLAMGDVLASGGGWSRPVRIGGLRFGRALSLRPGFDAAAGPGASASAALPASALGFNGSWLGAPGRPGAVLPAPPPSLPAVSAATLLTPGASDHEVEIGRLRTGWGTAEDRYGQPYAAAAWRRGLLQGLTGELRGEWTPSRRAAGLELVRGLDALGTLDAVIARSQTEQAAGLRWGLGLANQRGAAHWRVSWDGYQREYTPVALAAGEGDPRERWRAELRGALSPQLDAALTLARSSWWDAPAGQSLGLAVNWQLAHGSRLSLQLSDDEGAASSRRSRLVWSVPLGG